MADSAAAALPHGDGGGGMGGERLPGANDMSNVAADLGDGRGTAAWRAAVRGSSAASVSPR